MARKDHSSHAHPDIPNKPDKTNWVEKRGGLPSFIERVAKHIRSDSGYTVSRAIAAAISQVKKMAAKGNKQAIAAIAQWEKMKGSSKVTATMTKDDIDFAAVHLTGPQEARLDAALVLDAIVACAAQPSPRRVGLARVLDAAQGRDVAR